MNARGTDANTGKPLDGSSYAQLMMAPMGGTRFRPIGAPTLFRDTPQAAHGDFTGQPSTQGRVDVPGFAAGSTIQAKVIAWPRSLGEDIESILARGNEGFGESMVMDGVLLGGRFPDGLARPWGFLLGLQDFEIRGRCER